MAKYTGRNPITRTVRNGGVMYCDKHYPDDALKSYEQCNVLMDPIIDVDSDRITGFTVYDSEENEICEIELEESDG